MESAFSADLPSRIRFRHLSCFVAIAQERNLRRAAERLHLNQSAVSKTLGELEALAGMQLVKHGRQGARLTAAGEQFLRHAVGVTQALESATAALMGLTDTSALVAHVDALSTVASSLLPQVVAHLHTQRPYAGVRLRTGTSTKLLTALKADELDFIVGRIAEPDCMQGLSLELLYAEPLALIMRPGHPLLTLPGTSASLQAVLDYSFVVATPDTMPRHHTKALFQTHGLRLPAGTTETLSVSVARLLACRSDAMWITPECAAGGDLARGRLARLDTATSGTKEPVGLLRRNVATPSRLASAFMELLTELAQTPI